MNLHDKVVVLTGAAGGIGSELTRLLAGRGARVALLDRNPDALQTLVQAADDPGRLLAVPVDLLDAVGREAALNRVRRKFGVPDLLINNAGILSFRPFADEDPVLLERIVRLNTLTPMLIARQLLPDMLARGSGRIVNVGSTFGSIGFAWFSAYSASKFGLRGFSEALRRELDGSGIDVTYVAPRAVKTALNTGAVYRMAEAVKMNMDQPARVARQILAAIEGDAKDRYLGFPESLFARINALLPRLVDGALRKQNLQMQAFAKGEPQ